LAKGDDGGSEDAGAATELIPVPVIVGQTESGINTLRVSPHFELLILCDVTRSYNRGDIGALKLPHGQGQ
jgi:hypothetical protein